MDYNKQIDSIISEAVSISLDKMEAPEDMFFRIETGINNSKGRTKSRIWASRFHCINFKKASITLLCGLFIICTLSVLSFPNVRTFAASTTESILRLFTMEKINGEYKVVETKPTDAIFSFSVNEATSLSDSDISKKVGYSVVFPQSVYGGYTLSGKDLFVSINKKVDYITMNDLEVSMHKAINDDIELHKLKQFDAKREVAAVYKNDSGIITLGTKGGNFDDSAEKVKEIKVGEIRGKWLEFQSPVYPESNNSKFGPDLTKKPTGMITKHMLIWEWKGVGYCLYYKDRKIALEEVAKIAESFMESQR